MSTSNQDKIDLLMNKLSELEVAFKEERRIRMAHEEEIQIYKNITIPNLERQIEDKENLLKTIFIDKIKLEKEKAEKSKSEVNLIKNEISIINFNNNNNFNQNKLEYFQNSYKDLRKKYNDLTEEKLKLEYMMNSKSDVEKEKNEILLKNCDQLEKKVHSGANNLKILTEANKNLIIEVKSLNNILSEINKNKETLIIELNYYKQECDLTKLLLKDTTDRIKKVDNDFKAISRTLTDTQNKLSNVGISSQIFNVVRIGRLYESNVDLIFTKNEKGHMILIIKYVTTSIKYQILEILDIRLKEGEENIFVIEFQPSKNLRNEIFRSNEGSAIVKIFQEFQKKSYEQMDKKKIEAEENKKIENIEHNLNDILSFP